MRHVATLSTALVLLAGIGLSTGCSQSSGSGGDSTVQGSIQDSAGSQPQALLGGSGTVAATTQVRISSVGSGSALTTLATASVQTGGTYSVSVPSGETQLLIEALNSGNGVTASAIIETTGTAGTTTTVAPINTETSVEAQVFLSMVAKGIAVSDINTIDLRQRINLDVASAVNAAASADVQTRIDALADAIIAAQATQVKTYAQNSVSVSQADLFQAELSAAVALDTALANGSTTAYGDFNTAIDAALAAKNITEKARAQAESAAAVCFRATLKVRLAASDAVTDAALRQAAVIEANTSTAAVQAILLAASANATATAAANTAAANLETSTATATTEAQSAAAFSAYIGAMANSSASASLGSFVGVTVTTQATLDAAVAFSATAATTLQSAIDAAVDVSVHATGTVDYDTLATAVSTSFAAFNTSLQTQVSALSTFGADAQPAVDLLVVVQASGHAS
jgi:hypothetical protein